MYLLGGKDNEFANYFIHKYWFRVLVASTLEEYDAALTISRTGCKDKPKVTEYVENTWLVHKEKFVLVWTNHVLHFGNTTTCWVESAHASLKQWLNTCTGSLSTVWEKINVTIDSQQTEIRFVFISVFFSNIPQCSLNYIK